MLGPGSQLRSRLTAYVLLAAAASGEGVIIVALSAITTTFVVCASWQLIDCVYLIPFVHVPT